METLYATKIPKDVGFDVLICHDHDMTLPRCYFKYENPLRPDGRNKYFVINLYMYKLKWV